MSSKYRHLYQFCYVKIFSTNQYGNLVLLDKPGRVRSQITSVVCQIQRFDFDCKLVRIQAVLGLNPLYAPAAAARASSGGSGPGCGRALAAQQLLPCRSVPTAELPASRGSDDAGCLAPMVGLARPHARPPNGGAIGKLCYRIFNSTSVWRYFQLFFYLFI